MDSRLVGLMDGIMGGQMDGWMDGLKVRTDRWMEGQIYRQMDRETGGFTDDWMDRIMQGWMDGTFIQDKCGYLWINI